MNTLTFNDRVLGGLWGAVIGDALGVPVEFRSRETMRQDPVTDLREFGTYSQPKGTWSDDSALLLCTADSLAQYEFDTQDIGQRFVRWIREGLWTSWGDAFDVGNATMTALRWIEKGVPPEQAGGTDEYSNGNGSLMRILPIALRFANEPPEQLIAYAHRASAITHGHPRSQMACGIYCLLVAELLRGTKIGEAYKKTIAVARPLYGQAPFKRELSLLEAFMNGSLPSLPEAHIASGGYVLDSLNASLWCLMNSSSYEETVLKAVNLGGDTDTTGTVAGGLAGVYFGLPSVPDRWRRALARTADLEELFGRFMTKLETVK